MSPIKMSKNHKPYFNLEIEDESKVHHAVCFSAAKKELFKISQQEKVGIHTKNIKLADDQETIFINNHSQVKQVELGFPLRSAVEYLSVQQIINEIEPECKINVMGHVILEEPITRNVQGLPYGGNMLGWKAISLMHFLPLQNPFLLMKCNYQLCRQHR